MRRRFVRIVFIVGPTATGKTALAVKLAAKIGGDIVSADSMQAYKGMEIVSQAPTASERRRARHHLTGYIDPRKESNVASFRRSATRAIRSIIKRKKIPIVVGGSGLYVKALVDGLFPSPAADVEFRKKMQGRPGLYKMLSKIDPVSASRIHPNDERRIIRALEIHHATGKTMTELASETRGLKDEYDISIFGLNMARGKLYGAIERRVERMFKAGAVDEVRRLSKKRLSKTAAAVLGLKEIKGFLNGEYGIEEARELLKKNTRHFAKRQLAWFRADKRIKWFDVSRVDNKEIVKKIYKSLSSPRKRGSNK